MAEVVDNATVRLAFPPLRVFPKYRAIEIFCTGQVMDIVTNNSRHADGYLRHRTLLPELRIIGGCCGKDHTHIDAVSEHMFADATDEVG